MTEQQEYAVVAMDFPEWFDGKNVDEIVFCREFCKASIVCRILLS